VGEFGPVYTGDPERDSHRYRTLADQLSLYDEHGAGWSLWTYKDIGLQGLATVPADSPYLTRTAPVLRKKERLGVDVWGGVDTDVRHILDPLEKTVAAEFPGFDPLPFGQKQWIHVLVRHILLAEPMVDDFARCFEGLDADGMRAMADCFALERCTVRPGLLDMLKEHL
jgi:hypothetical protein